MPVVRIKPIAFRPDDNSYDFEVSQPGRHSNVSLAQISQLSTADAEEVRWYLEDYISRSSYEITRATKAAKILGTHGRDLVRAIDWEAVLRQHDLQETLLVEVEDSPDQPGPHILWELLERKELWGPSVRLPGIAVLRLITHSKPRRSSTGNPSMSNTDHTDVMNILLLSARPDADRDIPHRLVSRIILDVIKTVPDAKKRTVNLELVRPGTFEAFKAHLEARGAGFFDLVHFDLHGTTDDSGKSAFLAFLKTSGAHNFFKFQPDYVSASDIGVELERYCVKRVVLNACRSAQGQNTQTNIASTFIHSSALQVVAMSYNIVGRAVEIFTKYFYEELLHGELPFEGAVCRARAAMLASPERISKFGSMVAVHDHVVPVIYTDASAMVLHSPLYVPITELPKTFSFQPTAPFGRELDILQLESALLIGRKPVLLTGPAGVGKTFLLTHLQSWWKETGLIIESIHFMLAEAQGLDTLHISLHEEFIPEEAYSTPDQVLKYLRENRCLIILDSLETMTANTDAKSRRKWHQVLLKFLKALEGGKTLVVIISRRNETWLGSHTIPHGEEGLMGLLTLPGMQQISAYLEDPPLLATLSGKFAEGQKYESEEDKQYFEQIIKLVDGNPLAIKTVMFDFVISSRAPKDYFLGLLKGTPMSLNRMEYKRLESHRSLVELEAIVDSLNPTTLGEGFVPIYFSLFWKVFPGRDIVAFVRFFNLQTRKIMFGGDTGMKTYLDFVGRFQESATTTPEFQTVIDRLKEASSSEDKTRRKPLISTETFLLFWEDEIPKDDPFLNMVDDMTRVHCDRIINPLKAHGFLEAIDSDSLPAELREKEYLKSHPLLPILLRAEPGWEQTEYPIAEIARNAFPLFYAGQAKRWPAKLLYYNEAWALPRKELDLEFANYASAAFLGLDRTLGDLSEQSAILRFLMLVHRGVLADSTRMKIIIELWEKAVDILLKQEKKLAAKSENPTGLSMLERLRLSTSKPQPKEDDMETNIYLFQTRVLAANLSGTLLNHYYHLDNEGQVSTLARRIERIVRDAKRQKPPPGLSTEDWEWNHKALDYLLFCVHQSASGKNDLNVLWKAREEYNRGLIQHYGLETYPETQRGWRDVPHASNSTSAIFSRLLTDMLEIREKIDAARYEEARKLIDDALLVEMNQSSNDAMNKATLLRLRAEVDEKQERWADALWNYDEAERLEESVSVDVGTIYQKIARRTHRNKLARKVSKTS